MSYKLGMPSLIELNNIEETVKLCQKLSLSFVELNMNIPMYNPQNLDAQKIRTITEKTKIGFTLHLPDDIDLASFNLPIRRGNIECCKEALEWSAKAGIKLINLHLSKGPYFTLPDQKIYMYKQYQNQHLKDLEDSFKEISELAQKLKIKVCIENVGNFFLTHIEKAIPKLMLLDGIGLTWDVGHDARCGFRETKTLLKFKEKIYHMHLHDYDGQGDHRPLFEGNINIEEYLAFAFENKIGVLIEVKTVQALENSIKKLSL